MSISLLLEMAVSGGPDRTAVVSDDAPDHRGTQHPGRRRRRCHRGIGSIPCGVCRGRRCTAAATALRLGSRRRARSPRPNYRLSRDGLHELIERLPEPLVVADAEYADMVAGAGKQVVTSEEFLAAARQGEPRPNSPTPTRSRSCCSPRAPHRAPRLSSSPTTTSPATSPEQSFGGREEDAALICVPPYHIAGVSAAMSNLYAGRKMVYLRHFDADKWVELVRTEGITSATVVPTMLDRIVTALEAAGLELPTLRNLAYGGSKLALPLVRKALQLLPNVGFVNAYGLTETSSTIAVLGPDDHREALAAEDAAAARRLGSVGQVVPNCIEVQIRAEDGAVLGAGMLFGELFVRGEQVSGRYTDIGSVLDAEGWFPTKDVAMLDEGGYLFIGGRSDDTIIPRRREHRAGRDRGRARRTSRGVRDVAVVGPEDPQWGQMHRGGRGARRGSSPDPDALARSCAQTTARVPHPDRVVFRDELPTNPTGKVLRRQLVDELAPAAGVSVIKNGTRLQSQVCDTQVIVVRSADDLDDLARRRRADDRA